MSLRASHILGALKRPVCLALPTPASESAEAQGEGHVSVILAWCDHHDQGDKPIWLTRTLEEGSGIVRVRVGSEAVFNSVSESHGPRCPSGAPPASWQVVSTLEEQGE